MRKKPNLVPRMAACEDLLIKTPEELMGEWLEVYSDYDELHLELGCGKGRFTAEMCDQNRNVFFVAVEKVPDAMVVAMERAKAKGLTNVRFLDFDAANCRSIFESGEVDRIYINFPDPWKKNKQSKRRLTARSFLDIYEVILKPEGEIWFKTDNRPLFDWSIEQFTEAGWELDQVTNDLHKDGVCGVMTDYEKKFYEQGIPINRLVAKKVGIE